MGDELDALLSHYFELGVAEGAQGRSHDTEAGEAQATLDLIRLHVERAITSATAKAMERAAQIVDDMPARSNYAIYDAIAAAIRAEASKKGGEG